MIIIRSATRRNSCAHISINCKKIIQPIEDLIIGLEILEPFLKRQGFVLDNYKKEENAEGHFIVASFKNERKKFIINYKDSIRQVIYQFDDSVVCHDFYLDQLGLADKKQLLNFQSDNKLIVFKHILEDFEFLVSDFFYGDCIKLKEFSKRLDKVITIHNKDLEESTMSNLMNLVLKQLEQNSLRKTSKEV